jgi:hypothetical protein
MGTARRRHDQGEELTEARQFPVTRTDDVPAASLGRASGRSRSATSARPACRRVRPRTHLRRSSSANHGSPLDRLPGESGRSRGSGCPGARWVAVAGQREPPSAQTLWTARWLGIRPANHGVGRPALNHPAVSCQHHRRTSTPKGRFVEACCWTVWPRGESGSLTRRCHRCPVQATDRFAPHHKRSTCSSSATGDGRRKGIHNSEGPVDRARAPEEHSKLPRRSRSSVGAHSTRGHGDAQGGDTDADAHEGPDGHRSRERGRQKRDHADHPVIGGGAAQPGSSLLHRPGWATNRIHHL